MKSTKFKLKIDKDKGMFAWNDHIQHTHSLEEIFARLDINKTEDSEEIFVYDEEVDEENS